MTDNRYGDHLLELDEPLRTAVCELRAKPVQAEDVARVTRKTQRLTPPVRPARSTRLRRSAAISMIAASVAIASAVALLVSPGHSWAAVAQALQEKPWVRMRWKDADGTENVTWVSLSRDVAARQIGADRLFHDFRLGIRYEYFPSQTPDAKVVRRLLPGDADEDFQSFESQWVRLLAGEAPSGSPVKGGELANQVERQIVDDGRTWIEYELAVRQRISEQNIQMVFRVDPETNLPVQLRMVHTRGDRSKTVEMQLDYPDEPEGPLDIYSLGVSRDTQLVDLVPDDDVRTVLARLDASIDRFGDFRAIMKGTSGDESLLEAAPTLHVVWRKGNKWRVSIATPNDPRAMPSEAEVPPGEEFRTEWWFEQLKYYDVRPTLICDGQTIYRNNSVDEETPKWERLWNVDPEQDFYANVVEASRVRPDFYGYQAVRHLSGRGKLRLLAAERSELPGAIILQSDGVKFWVDPARSYVALKYEYQTDDRTDRVFNEKFDRTPSGVWYPTVVREEVAGVDGYWRRWFFVDFDANLRDELFSP